MSTFNPPPRQNNTHIPPPIKHQSSNPDNGREEQDTLEPRKDNFDNFTIYVNKRCANFINAKKFN